MSAPQLTTVVPMTQRLRLVATIGPGAHAGFEVSSELRRGCAHLFDRVGDPALHVAARALARRAELALATSEADGARELCL